VVKTLFVNQDKYIESDGKFRFYKSQEKRQVITPQFYHLITIDM